MKQALTILLLFSTLAVSAQQNQGRIVYERVTKLQIQINDPAFQNSLPQERKDKYELLFSGNKTLWRAVEDESPESDMSFDNGAGAHVKIMVPGSNDITYSDLMELKKIEQKELFAKTFIVEDSIRKLKWKLGNDTKKIIGYDCRMATSQKIQSSMKVTMDNGEMKRQEVMDTATIVAWFTDAIPGFGGPDAYQGQLPGTILEVDINNGRSHFVALEISPKVDVKEIKEPKGKRITPEEFKKERDKMFEQMQKNNGGNFNIKGR
jgi:GLPGLI family protein